MRPSGVVATEHMVTLSLEQQELDQLNAYAESLPYAESELDIRARNIVREAAAMLQARQAKKDK